MSEVCQLGACAQQAVDNFVIADPQLQAGCQKGKELCAAPENDVVVLTDQGQMTDDAGNLLAYKTFTFARKKLGDCEWKNESITVFSNGNYKDVYELKDHGTVFGDCFATAIKLQSASGHTFHEWKWGVKVAAGATWNDTVSGNSNAVKEAFNAITVASRDMVCSWPCY